MSFIDIQLKKTYSSDDDDILHDFYIPILTNAFEYHRLAGFFSSTSLAVAAKGILGLIKNNGTMKLLVSPQFNSKDIDMLKSAYKDSDQIITDKFLEELEITESDFVYNHVQALGWMIANERLDIRVAVICDDHRKPLQFEAIQQKGIFHQKVGVLKDNNSNIVSFSGSVNETASAWLNNIEEFKVFRSWDPSEAHYIEADIQKFDRFWNSRTNQIITMTMPQAIKEKMIEISPTDVDDLNLEKLYKKTKQKKKVELYNYQQEAVDTWFANGNKGIFEMATGTGKTFTALGCISELQNKTAGLLIIIACPKNHLVQQWKKETDKFGTRYDKLIIADSTNKKWKNELHDTMIDLSLGYISAVLIITTHTTFSSSNFKSIISENAKDVNTLLIGDEVHGLGSEQFKTGLLEIYDYRLGLSATPKRFYDSVGTNKLYDFFHGVVFEFPLQKAINNINPATGQTFLTPYRYIPRFITLTSEELEIYQEQTLAIIRVLNRKEKDEEYEKLYEQLLFKRANIIKDAEEKYDCLNNLLDEIDHFEWTIIYCNPGQIDNVIEILNDRRITTHRFTMDEGIHPSSKFGGKSEREYILECFAEKKFQILVAMSCLDEGVDVPAARTAILMASSGNPRQYIQRIGRVIRRHPGKIESNIYDFIVVPSFDDLSQPFIEIEKAIFEKECKRYEEISNIAINSAEALRLISDLRASF